MPLLLGDLWLRVLVVIPLKRARNSRSVILIDTKDELKSVGIFDCLNDSWTMNVDLSTAESTAGGNGDDGVTMLFRFGQAVAMQWMDFRTDITRQFRRSDGLVQPPRWLEARRLPSPVVTQTVF